VCPNGLAFSINLSRRLRERYPASSAGGTKDIAAAPTLHVVLSGMWHCTRTGRVVV
jgi:hypothetical protein